MKSQFDATLIEIQEKTAKLTGEDFSQKPGETVKLRNKTTKSVAELEQLVEVLKRVNDKQKNEVDSIKKENAILIEKVKASDDAPMLKRRIEGLE